MLHGSQSRRQFIQTSLGAAGLSLAYLPLGFDLPPAEAADAATGKPEPLPVAAIVTVWRKNSHASCIAGKILEGWRHDGGAKPDLKLVSLYTDQVPEHDQGAAIAKKHNVRYAKSIEEALTLGGNKLAVAGVLLIGEHGQYPITPDTGQVMHPRRKFFDEIVATYRKCGQIAPIFNDKHLAPFWADAKHMYDTAVEMKIPFMAGSSVPVMWRKPEESFPIGSEVIEAVALGYGPLEHYGFHSLEGMQCLLERRKGGETGVKSVQSVTGEGIWQAQKEGRWSQEVFDAVVAASPTPYAGRVKRPDKMAKDAVFYLIDYKDGTRGTVAMGTGFTHEFSCAVSIRGREKPFAVQYVCEDEEPFGHFEHLLRAVEVMFHTKKAAYPIERTLLTTGILDRALHSLADKNKKLETPELAISYTPVDWPFPKGSPPPPVPAK